MTGEIDGVDPGGWKAEERKASWFHLIEIWRFNKSPLTWPWRCSESAAHFTQKNGIRFGKLGESGPSLELTPGPGAPKIEAVFAADEITALSTWRIYLKGADPVADLLYINVLVEVPWGESRGQVQLNPTGAPHTPLCP